MPNDGDGPGATLPAPPGENARQPTDVTARGSRAARLGLNLVLIGWLYSFLLLSLAASILFQPRALSYYFSAAPALGLFPILPGMWLGCRALTSRTARVWMALFALVLVLALVFVGTAWGAFEDNEQVARESLKKIDDDRTAG
jgi:hypothetical protein